MFGTDLCQDKDPCTLGGGGGGERPYLSQFCNRIKQSKEQQECPEKLYTWFFGLQTKPNQVPLNSWLKKISFMCIEFSVL